MTTTAPRPDVVVTPLAWKTLTCVSLVGFMVSIEISIISLALQDIRDAFADESVELLSWIFNGYNITVAALLLPAGWVSDRLGRQTVFCAGVLTFALGSLLAGLAPSLEFLVAARVLQGIGGAFQIPAGMALLLAAFPVEKRQLGIGVWGATSGLAAAFGPTLGAILVSIVGWRSIFLINVPLAIAILVVAPRWLWPAAPDPTLGRVDLVAVPLASLSVGACIVGLMQGESWGWGSARTISYFVVAGVLFTAFIWRSWRHPKPLFDLALFKIRSFSVGALGQSAFVGAFFLWLIPLPTFVRAVWGWSVIKTGFAIAPGPLVAMITAPLSGKASDEIGPRIPLVVSGVLGTIGIALQLRWISTEPDFLLGLFIPSLFIGAAAGIALAGTVGAMVVDVEPRHFAMASAARSTLFQLSLSLAVALGFIIIRNSTSDESFLDLMRTTWFVAMGLYTAQFLIFYVLYPRRDHDPVTKVQGWKWIPGMPLAIASRPSGRGKRPW